MSSHDKYGCETFCAETAEFDRRFSDYLNDKYHSGFKHKSCTFESVGGKTHARCLFKRR